MKEAARQFEGAHDFTSFAASTGSEDDDKDREMVRDIFRSEIIAQPYAPFGASVNAASMAHSYPGYRAGDAIEEAAHELDYVVHGKSFLRYMVRKIVGTLLDVGRGKLAPSDIAAIFDSKDRSRSGPTVPPDGLYLVSLEYPDPTASLAHERRKSEAKIG
jgi:tRNA U38,U39,U40 pseudouridine synthase TruA